MVNWRRGDLLVYSDRSIYGTFVGFEQENSEDGYVKIKYVPFNTRGKKVVTHPIPIRKEHIKNVISPNEFPGTEERVMFIFTGEENSVIKDIIDAENIRTIKSLQDQIRGLKKQIASTRQEASDAQTGVSKTIENLQSIKKTTRPEMNDFNSYGNRGMPNFDDVGSDY